MRRICCVHGISAGGREARRGFAAGFKRAAEAWSADVLGLEDPVDVREVIWAGLAQSLAVDVSWLPRGLGVLYDYAIDVAIYAAHREAIKRHVAEQLLAAGPCVVLAHSLGSVVMLDLVTEWVESGAIAADVPRELWPVLGLVTIGSPLGGDVPFAAHLGFRDRDRTLADLVVAGGVPSGFRWVNVADRDDPVVQCSLPRLVFNAPPPNLSDAARFPGFERLGVVQLPDIDTGGLFASHAGYWTHPTTVSAVVSMATSP